MEHAVSSCTLHLLLCPVSVLATSHFVSLLALQDLHSIRSIDLTSQAKVSSIAGTGTSSGSLPPDKASLVSLGFVNGLALTPDERALFFTTSSNGV